MKKNTFLLLLTLAICWVSCEKTDLAEGDISRKVVHSEAKTVFIDTQLLLSLINELRTQGCECAGQGKLPAVKPLTLSHKLTKAAEFHSVDMYKHERLSHEGSNGSSIAQRISAQGYKFSKLGENVAVGSTTEAQVVAQWKNSGAHCANMMSSQFSQMGIGRSGNYWTLLLATPQ